jgi:hypothetical protein
MITYFTNVSSAELDLANASVRRNTIWLLLWYSIRECHLMDGDIQDRNRRKGL